MPSPEALAWARRIFPDIGAGDVSTLPPAGSSRVLTRLSREGGSVVLVENPVAAAGAANENDAFVYLAAHLAGRGVPVPAVLAYERSRGWYLVEDLGDCDLYALAREALHDPDGAAPAAVAHIAALYREALEVLVRLQVDGADGFDPRRTHNPPRYDAALMREWESGYFLRELAGRHLALPTPDGLEAELDALAAAGERAGAAYLLHRDYQSQNLKVHRGRIGVIDFQGARLGPPQYDAAALLLDPYADLPSGLRDALLRHYLDAFAARTGTPPERFLEHYPVIAAHRLMQALGAYAYLGLQRGRPAFLAHVPAALRLLGEVLAPLAATAPRLVSLVEEARRRASGGLPA